MLLVKKAAFPAAEIEKAVLIEKPAASPTAAQPVSSTSDFSPKIKDLPEFDEYDATKFKKGMVDVEFNGPNYRREEAVARTGERWLGLFFENGEYFLKNTRVRVVRNNEPPDELGFDFTIKFDRRSKPLLLFKNVGLLRESKVLTLFQYMESEDSDDADVMRRGFRREYRIGETKYVMTIEDGLTKSGKKALALVLESGGVRQVIAHEAYFDDDYLGVLLWAGDLDSDGKLDLYIKANDWEKGFFYSSLFLSSPAGKGQLLKKAADFFTAGC